MFLVLSRVSLAFYLVLLCLSPVWGIHVDHSEDPDQSHVCLEVCVPLDDCRDGPVSESHEEESLLEHILDDSALRSKSFKIRIERDVQEILQHTFESFNDVPHFDSWHHASTDRGILNKLSLKNSLVPRAPPFTS